MGLAASERVLPIRSALSYAVIALCGFIAVSHYAGFMLGTTWIPNGVPTGIITCIVLSVISIGNLDGWRFSSCCHITAALVGFFGLLLNATNLDFGIQNGWYHLSSSTSFMTFLLLAAAPFVSHNVRTVCVAAAAMLALAAIGMWGFIDPDHRIYPQIGVIAMALPSAVMTLLLCASEYLRKAAY